MDSDLWNSSSGLCLGSDLNWKIHQNCLFYNPQKMICCYTDPYHESWYGSGRPEMIRYRLNPDPRLWLNVCPGLLHRRRSLLKLRFRSLADIRPRGIHSKILISKAWLKMCSFWIQWLWNAWVKWSKRNDPFHQKDKLFNISNWIQS